MFDKNRLMKYMQDNFNLDDFSIKLINGIIEYGEEICIFTKRQLLYFVYDILSKAEPSIDFREIEKFYHE